jgi:hypothetical protein
MFSKHCKGPDMNKVIANFLIFSCCLVAIFGHVAIAHDKSENLLLAHKASTNSLIDGKADETSWALASWQPLDHLMSGSQPTADDFSGRFKILWDAEQLYLLVEVVDNILFDQHADPLHFYWDDDCLEVFIDEDASGGNHQFNFNAFAYHIALDNQVVDIGPNKQDGSTNFVLLNEHLNSVWRRRESKPHKIIWEVALRVYGDDFTLYSNNKNQQPVTLTLGKTLGFMLAYCDNDGSKERENFMGSTDIKPVNGDKNLGYITADVFQKLKLIE